MMNNKLSSLPIIHTIDLFPEVNKSLITLLKDLSLEEWQLSTVLPERTVKDLAAHLLDGSLRRLSFCRDHFQPTPPKITQYQDLIDYIQMLNREWIMVCRRLSPQVLIELLTISETALYEYFKTLDPVGRASFSVAWAGEEISENWFDIARDYTEKWHHQMQIRLAVHRPILYQSKLFSPIVQTFMRALPYAYRDTARSENTGIKIIILGEGGGIWHLQRTHEKWEFVDQLIQSPAATLTLSGEIFWQLVTDSMDKKTAVQYLQAVGDISLCEPFLNMKAVLR